MESFLFVILALFQSFPFRYGNNQISISYLESLQKYIDTFFAAFCFQ